jgi:hypothetical protein
MAPRMLEDQTMPHRRFALALGFVGISLLAACSAEGDGSDDPSEQAQTATSAVILRVRDVWAQPIPERELKVQASQAGRPIAITTDGDKIKLSVTSTAPVRITASAEDFEEAQIDLVLAPNGALTATSPKEGRAGVAIKKVAGKTDHEVWIGIRHLWFSSEARPARRGNRVTLLMDGEEAWANVHSEIVKAKKQILASTWWWESRFELVRPAATHAKLTPEQRRANTVIGLFEASPATKRVLVNQFLAQDSFVAGLNVDSELKVHGEKGGDNFEYLGQANATSGKFAFAVGPVSFVDRVKAQDPTQKDAQFSFEAKVVSDAPKTDVDLTQWPVKVDLPHASWHQKFMVVDQTAFVGGMNLRRVDWDTNEHKVFDSRRMLFDATEADRNAVAAKDKKPDAGPRKDYIMRVDGPAAADVTDLFHKRWERALKDRVEYSQNASDFVVERTQVADPNGVMAQITATMPEPIAEHGILESWHNAIRQAKDYIFIEDQYFRMPILNDAIAARMNEIPALKLIVVTKPINEYTDPGCFWTYKSADQFRKGFPNRFLLLQLRAFDTGPSFGIDETKGEFAAMDVHSKMLIVDDRFMSVGSANKNNRGVLYEGELNVAVLDKAVVSAARKRILTNMLGETAPDTSGAFFDKLAASAKANDAVYQAWDAESFDLNLNGAALPAKFVPKGFVYSLVTPDPTECLLESVGPDVAKDPKQSPRIPD